MFSFIKRFLEKIKSHNKVGNTITINGESFEGNSVVINNGNIIIDGKKMNSKDEKEITINIEGNLDKLEVDHCEEISISGHCHKVSSGSGDVSVGGNVLEGVSAGSGNIKCGDVGGNVKTGSGNVSCKDISGNVKTSSGNIKHS